MRKLCLILTVLYAFGANCSAQSSLNIATNLLTGDNSTFNSGWGNWGDQGDSWGKSLEPTGGSGGSQCARLTPQANAAADHNAQLKYDFKAAKGTTYVFRLKAKKVSGSGTIQAIMQHNSDGFEQQHFFDKDVSESWAIYEGEVTANRSDYDVIMINYGKCGEVWIDDIEFGVKAVAPKFTIDLNPPYTVGEGGTLDLTVEASGTPAPTYQWYSNTTNNTAEATPIDGATTASYSVPTTAQGTTYYYCVATNSQGSATSTIAEVTVTGPVSATGVTLNRRSASVKQGRSITLTATVEPSDAANRNVRWSSSDESVATVNNGVVTGVAPGNAKITVTTEDGKHTASCTVTVTTFLPPVMLYDFNDATDVSKIAYPNHSEEDRNEHLYVDIIEDPYSDGQCLSVSDGNHKQKETLVIDLGPSGVDFGGYGILAFDINFQKEVPGKHEDFNYKDVVIKLECQKKNGTTEDVPLQTFSTPVFPAPVWDTKLIPLTTTVNGKTVSVIPDGATPVKLKIGEINSRRCIYLIDNIRIKENVDDVEDYEQDKDLSDIWWKYADAEETLYIKGTGPIPAYTGNKTCPWENKTPYIKHVIVSEGITGIGDYSVGNSQLDNVDITLHSIPEYFGAHCLERERQAGLTRTLHLQLWDKEKPFIAKTKSTYFPTFNTAKYFRDVTNTYSTVCLPFPVAKETVTAAGVKLFDFTSIKKNGEQYTLAFTKHSGGMAAGQTYLIKEHNIEGTLQKTNVTKEQFNLTPAVSKNTVENSDPSFSISMTGVFQPSVFGPNLGTEDAPVYAYGFQNENFYMNGGNMSVRPMRGYFYGSKLYSAPVQGGQQQSGAKKMPKMFNFEIVPDNVTHISSPAFIAEDFNIEEVYSPSGMKTESLNKGLNIIRTSTGRVLKVMVK